MKILCPRNGDCLGTPECSEDFISSDFGVCYINYEEIEPPLQVGKRLCYEHWDNYVKPLLIAHSIEEGIISLSKDVFYYGFMDGWESNERNHENWFGNNDDVVLFHYHSAYDHGKKHRSEWEDK